MNNKCGKNTAASVRDRLLALARERGEDFQLLLTQYGLERLLYRLSQSSYRDRFILKGAMLFLLWGDQPHRPTRDVDFLGFGDSSEAGLQAIFRELCGIPVEDDGLTLTRSNAIVLRNKMESPWGVDLNPSATVDYSHNVFTIYSIILHNLCDMCVISIFSAFPNIC